MEDGSDSKESMRNIDEHHLATPDTKSRLAFHAATSGIVKLVIGLLPSGNFGISTDHLAPNVVLPRLLLC